MEYKRSTIVLRDKGKGFYKMNLQEKIKQNQSILGVEVIGVDGCQGPYTGEVKEVSVFEHKILGTLIQVWVEWDNKKGHLTPYTPNQFQKWNNQRTIGVYVSNGMGVN